MSDDDSEKSFDPTPERLQKAREDGDVPKSNDLLVAASYLGVLIAFYTGGREAVETLGTLMMAFIDKPDRLASMFLDDAMSAPISAELIKGVYGSVISWFLIPAILIVLAVYAQKAMVFAPKRIQPKWSNIDPIKNFKNKFGRSNLFEFTKGLFKLMLYAACLGTYFSWKMPEMLAAVGTSAIIAVPLIAELSMEFLIIAFIIALAIGFADASFQQAEFIRKNMMSMQDLKDEVKKSEGDPEAKGKRKQKGMQIVKKQISVAVAKADVVIVNPTHYAVALQWSRMAGSAPECVAKGVDEVAAIIREIAQENGVPIHSDPPTARALYATVEVGQEIEEQHYAPVAAAVRFAEEMRMRARNSVL